MTKTACIAALIAASGIASADIEAYSQNFEGLDALSASALGDDGWLVGANVFSPGGAFLYNYFAFPAPNGDLDGGGFRFSRIATGEGGAAQGNNQLAVFSDYNNPDHGAGNLIEAVFFREYTVGAANVGQTIEFSFDAKAGDLAGSMSSRAFIKTLDPGAGFALTNFIVEDTTSIPSEWNTYSISLDITAAMVGNVFQIGFDTTGTNFDPSTNFYDNINMTVPTPASAGLLGLGGLVAARRRRS